MQRTLLFKLLIISVLSLLLLIPLGLIEGVVGERSRYRDSVKLDIAQSWTAQQDVAGPVLTVPYKEKQLRKVWDKEIQKYVMQEQYAQKHLYFFPQTLSINGDAVLQERYRGIYRVPIYTANLQIQGEFQLPEKLGIKTALSNIRWEDAYVSVEIGDIRGIKSDLKLRWADNDKAFLPGTNLHFLEQGIHAVLGKLGAEKSKTYKFSFDLDLNGMEYIRFAPIGKNTSVNLQSSWPHPKFIGRFLPETREIGEEGFTASWKTSYFSTNMAETLRDCNAGKCKGVSHSMFGVSFIQPVDVYHQTERSIKYAILFILLTFVIFFIFEILKRLPIHPIQYGLVGLGLAIFYLLLISLSEHISFTIAYMISSLACISLLSFYVSYVLRNIARGISFGGLIAFLYAILYTLIRSEDYALLMGSILVFGMLAAIMYFTRRIDWYQTVDVAAQKYKNTQSAK